MKNSASSVHSARQHTKRSHRWPEKLQPKRLCQTIVTIDVSIHSSQREQPPSPPSTPPYPVFAIFLFERFLCFCFLVSACCATGTEQPRPVLLWRGHHDGLTAPPGSLSGTFCFWFWRKLWPSEPGWFRRPLCCSVSTLRPLPHICQCVWVCVLIFLSNPSEAGCFCRSWPLMLKFRVKDDQTSLWGTWWGLGFILLHTELHVSVIHSKCIRHGTALSSSPCFWLLYHIKLEAYPKISVT